MITQADHKYSTLPDIETSKHSVKLMVLNSLTTGFLFGYTLSSINPVKNIIAVSLQWCSPDTSQDDSGSTYSCGSALLYGSVITVGPLAGAAIGCLIGGELLAFGRRNAILISHILYFFGNLLSGLAEGVLTLSTARIILGFAIGISTAATPLYIAEITPRKHRGTYGVLFQLAITIGILIGNILGLPVGGVAEVFDDLTQNPLTSFQSWWWRFTLGIPAVISLISIYLTLVFFKFETPHYMMIKKQYAECKSLLRTVNGKYDVQEEYYIIYDAVTEAERVKDKAVRIWTALNSVYYRNVILIATVLFMFQQFTGINVLTTNSNRLFSALGISANVQLILSVGLTALNVLMTFPPIFIIDRLGRRTLLLASISGMTLSVIPGFIGNVISPNSFATAIVSAISTFCFIIFFAIGYGPIPWVFVHEIFPVEIKQGASAFATACNWLAALIIVAPSDFLLKEGSVFIFSIFLATNIIGLVFIFFFIKETKGISIDDSPYFKNKIYKVKSLKKIHNSPYGSSETPVSLHKTHSQSLSKKELE